MEGTSTLTGTDAGSAASGAEGRIGAGGAGVVSAGVAKGVEEDVVPV
ncbi:hypothetical protein ABIB49_003838 [Arthrobacter sp. UYCu512]